MSEDLGFLVVFFSFFFLGGGGGLGVGGLGFRDSGLEFWFKLGFGVSGFRVDHEVRWWGSRERWSGFKVVERVPSPSFLYHTAITQRLNPKA